MSNIIQRLRKNILWTLQFIMVIIVAIWIGSLAVGAILSKVYPDGVPYLSDIRCAIGFPSQMDGQPCIQTALREALAQAKLEREALQREKQKVITEGKAAREKLRKAHAEILEDRDKTIKDSSIREAKLKAAQAKTKALLKKITDIEKRWTNIVLFKENSANGISVSSGVKYPSLTNGDQWSSAWCNYSPSGQDLPVNFTLGSSYTAGTIIWKEISDKQLKLANLNRSQIEDAKQLCQWPNNGTN